MNTLAKLGLGAGVAFVAWQVLKPKKDVPTASEIARIQKKVITAIKKRPAKVTVDRIPDYAKPAPRPQSRPSFNPGLIPTSKPMFKPQTKPMFKPQTKPTFSTSPFPLTFEKLQMTRG